MRQPAGPARSGAAWRAGRWVQPLYAALFRPGALPRGAVRSARLRAVAAHRVGAGQHHCASDRRHRPDPRAPWHRPLAAVRRQLGGDAGPGLCAGASGPCHRAGAARGVPGDAVRTGLVLWRGRRAVLSRPVGALSGADPPIRTPGHDRRLSPAAVRRRPGPSGAIRAALADVGKRAGGAAVAGRGPCPRRLRPRLCPAGESLFQQRLLPGRGAAAARPRADRTPARDHRPGPL